MGKIEGKEKDKTVAAEADNNVIMLIVWMIAVFVIPGALFNRAVGTNSVWALAASIPTSFGLFGLSGWLLSKIGVDFGPLSFMVSFIFAISIVIIGRILLRNLGTDRRGEDNESPAEVDRTKWSIWRSSLNDPVWYLPFIGVVTASVALMVKVINYFEELPAERGGFGAFPQGWDMHWHASELRFIAEEGIADSTRMGELRNMITLDPMFYPSGWHIGGALVTQMTGAHPIVILNVMSFVLPALLLPLGTALIAWRMVDNRTLLAQLGSALAAVSVVFVPTIFWIGSFVGALPYLTAVCMSGVVAIFFTTVPRHPHRAIPAALGFMGLVMMHPSAATIVAVLVAIWWLFEQLIHPTYRVETDTPSKARLRDFGVLAVTAVTAVIALLPQILKASNQAEEVQGWQNEQSASRLESWTEILGFSTRHTDSFGNINWLWFYILAIVGALVVLNWRHNVWAPVYFLASVAIAANALDSFSGILGDVLTMISSLHYSAAHRLAMPVHIVLFAAAGIGLAALIRTVCWFWAKSKTAKMISAGASIVLATIAGSVSLTVMNEVVDKGAEDLFADTYGDRMISASDRESFDWLAQQPHAFDGRIFGDANEGYGWMYSYNGLPSMSTHYTYSDNIYKAARNEIANDDTYLVQENLTQVGTGVYGDLNAANEIDKAVERLGINYIYLSAPSFWPSQNEDFANPVDIENTPGITLVYRNGEVWIYAINSMFTDQELDELRAQSPGDLAPVTTYGAQGLDVPADRINNGDTNPYNYNYYHRPR